VGARGRVHGRVRVRVRVCVRVCVCVAASMCWVCRVTNKDGICPSSSLLKTLEKTPLSSSIKYTNHSPILLLRVQDFFIAICNTYKGMQYTSKQIQDNFKQSVMVTSNYRHGIHSGAID